MSSKLAAAVATATVVLIVGVLVGNLSAFGGDRAKDDAHQAPGEDATPAPVSPVVPMQGAEEIRMLEGDTYTIFLESNPGTGSRRQLGSGFDQRLLELVDHRFEAGSDVNPPLLARAGTEVFTFRALGHPHQDRLIEFSLVYKRPWDAKVLKASRYIFNIEVSETLAEVMSEADAREIALDSQCVKEGRLAENAHYDDWTGARWIDMAVQEQGRRPACVVDVKTKQAEVNWRMTGLKLPPKDAGV